MSTASTAAHSLYVQAKPALQRRYTCLLQLHSDKRTKQQYNIPNYPFIFKDFFLLKFFSHVLFYVITIEKGKMICFLIFQDLSTNTFALVYDFTSLAYRQTLYDKICSFLCPFPPPFL